MSLSSQSSFIAGAAAIVAGLTLNEWAALAGILGVFAAVAFQWRRDRRETLALKIQLGEKPDRRAEARRCVDRECPPSEYP